MVEARGGVLVSPRQTLSFLKHRDYSDVGLIAKPGSGASLGLGQIRTLEVARVAGRRHRDCRRKCSAGVQRELASAGVWASSAGASLSVIVMGGEVQALRSRLASGRDADLVTARLRWHQVARRQ